MTDTKPLTPDWVSDLECNEALLAADKQRRSNEEGAKVIKHLRWTRPDSTVAVIAVTKDIENWVNDLVERRLHKEHKRMAALVFEIERLAGDLADRVQ